jgi:hypothetical protein
MDEKRKSDITAVKEILKKTMPRAATLETSSFGFPCG